MAKLEKMRGLKAYIQEIRNCSTKEQERERVDKELGKIRKKYTSTKVLSAYDKRKYMWKLLYTRMLGYDVDFGHKQAMDLIAASDYAEKQVGYVACSIFLNEKDEFLRLVINSVRNDLISRNEAHQCLALDFIANVGGKEFAELLTVDVMNVLGNGATRPIVRKKAALCLLRLLRKAPHDQDILPAEVWAVRLASLLEDRDLGVLLGLTTLLLGIVSRSYAGYEPCVSRIVRVLDRCKARDVPQDYTYYGLASPWLQVKALRVLQYFPPPQDPAVHRTLVDVLKRILGGSEQVKNVNKNNAVHAIVFEAVAVAIGLEEPDLMNMGVALLAKFLAVREPNLKYLALENMVRLAEVPAVVDAVARHQRTIIACLHDGDVSIRRRALDLLFTMCTPSTAAEIVDELLSYLGTAEYEMREELVLKTAVLAERFLPSLEWYVDSMLTLMERAGDSTIPDLWASVVQLVTNHPELHAYAARRAAEALRRGAAHEVFVKCVGYLLGEFGRLVAGEEGLSTLEQFRLLHARFLATSADTKAILLTAFEKMVVAEPDNGTLRQAVDDVLRRYSRFMDAELQQRAVEYGALAARLPMARTALAPLPHWEKRSSLLLRRLAEREGEEADEVRERPAWLVASEGDEEASQPGSATTQATGVGAVRAPAVSSAPSSAKAANGVADLLDLLDLGEPSQPAATAPAPAAAPATTDLMASLGEPAPAPAVGLAATALSAAPAPVQASAPAPIQPTGDVDAWLRKLASSASGVLYEDPYLQIGLKLNLSGSGGQLGIFLGNKSGEQLQRLVCTVPPSPVFSLQLGPVPAALEPKKQVQVSLAVTCLQPCITPPSLQVGYVLPSTGQAVSRSLALPLFVAKFCQPVEVPRQVFAMRWDQVAGPPFKLSAEVPRSGGPLPAAALDALLPSLNLQRLAGVDPDPSAVAAACVLHCGGPAPRQVPCMVKIGGVGAAGQPLSVAVATADAVTSDALKSELVQLLSAL